MEMNPESKDTEALHAWYEGERPNVEIKSISAQASSGTSNFGKLYLYYGYIII